MARGCRYEQVRGQPPLHLYAPPSVPAAWPGTRGNAGSLPTSISPREPEGGPRLCCSLTPLGRARPALFGGAREPPARLCHRSGRGDGGRWRPAGFSPCRSEGRLRASEIFVGERKAVEGGAAEPPTRCVSACCPSAAGYAAFKD